MKHGAFNSVCDSRADFRRHAGYAFSGPCAAYAYKALDLSKA